MKKLTFLLMAALLLILCTACSTQPAALSTADTPLRELVKGVVPTEGLTNMPLTDLEDVLGIDPADVKEAVYMQDEGMGGQEVLVVRAADKDAAARVTALMQGYLEQRCKETRNYAPEAYQLLSAARVETKNCTVALISGEKASEWSTAVLAGE